MKNTLSILGALIAIVCAAVSATGCISTERASAQVHEHWGGFGEISVPVKDFQPMAIVFTEVQFETDPKGNIDGVVFTYQALLKEAQKLGAHAIVNVTIDKVTQGSSKKEGYTTIETIQETWYGSALAVKYTDALTQENMTDGPITISPTRHYNLDSGVSTSYSQQSAGQPAGQPATGGFK